MQLWLVVCVVSSLALCAAMPFQMPKFNTTALDDYVNRADPTFKWEDTGIVLDFVLAKGYILNITSQTWLPETDVDCSVWWHYFIVVVPNHIKNADKPMIWIGDGSNDHAPPASIGDLGDSALAVEMAITTGSVTAALKQIPNQPCHFVEEEGSPRRSEDSLIAWTWKHFLDYPESPEWLLRLPMTKAVVRSMDVMTEFVKDKIGADISGFVIAGASKRGWTTWTTGAVDKRVIGIAPFVMDALNFVTNVHHMWRAYGGWTFAFSPYWNVGLTSRFDDPNMQAMADIIDPFVYRDRLTMPKLIVSTSDDEFFLPDDSHYYFSQMEGDSHMLVLRNAEHSCATGVPELLPALGAWYLSLLNDYPRPTFSQSIDKETGEITVVTSEKPTKVEMRYAHTPKDSPRRDFRWIRANINCTTEVAGECLQPILWRGKKVRLSHQNENGDFVYKANMEAPKVGWGAFFVEMHYKGPHIAGFTFTSQVSVVPDTFPYPECEGAGCKGELV